MWHFAFWWDFERIEFLLLGAESIGKSAGPAHSRSGSQPQLCLQLAVGLNKSPVSMPHFSFVKWGK